MKLDEAVNLVNFLRTIVQPIEGSKYVKFLDGWDDDKVARKFNLTTPQVSGARSKTIGTLKPYNGLPASRLLQIEEKVNDIMEYLTRTDPNWNVQ